MQAVVLVGGEGTRLRPLTYGTPKPMVPIFNVPFLERTLERLQHAGIEDVILPAGYLPEAITDYFGDGARLGLKLTYVIEEQPLGTAGAIKNVEEHITGPFFVLNGDVLTSLDLRKMMRVHGEQGGLGVLHLIRVPDPSSFGCVVHDATGRITRFVEKPPPGQEPTNEINAGTYLLERDILDFIPTGRKVSIERETFPLVIAGPRPLYAHTTNDYWIDLGRPEHYLASHRDVLAGTMPMDIGPRALHVSDNGRFAAGCVVEPSFIGENVTIEAGARVGPYAVLGDGSVVERGATVEHSVLWDHVRVGADARVEGAIIASGAVVGSSAKIAPGTVIGHDAAIAPGSSLPPDSRVGEQLAST